MTSKEVISTIKEELNFTINGVVEAWDELLSRLEKGDKAIVGEAIGFTTVENLKCCGNCSKYLDDFDNSKCGYPKSIYNNYCDKWENDTLGRDKRLIV